MHNFRELKVWQHAMKLAKDIYVVTKQFPLEEKFGITSQIRRASISVPSNIAEGTSRKSKNEFAHFLDVAIGSCYEVETQLLLSSAFGFLNEEQSNEILLEIHTTQKMLHGLKNTIIKQ